LGIQSGDTTVEGVARRDVSQSGTKISSTIVGARNHTGLSESSSGTAADHVAVPDDLDAWA